MWEDTTTGHNVIRIYDKNNAMKRHYNTLKQIDRTIASFGKQKSMIYNSKNKSLEISRNNRRRPPSAYIKRNLEVSLENKRMAKALHKVNSKYGSLSPQMLLRDYEKIRIKKNMRHIKLKKDELVKSNVRYHHKVKNVQPVYSTKKSKKEKKLYEKVKRKLDINNKNFRQYEIRAMNQNTQQISNYMQKRRKRKFNSSFNLKRSNSSSLSNINEKSMVQLNKDKVILLSNPRIKPPLNGYLQYFVKRPRGMKKYKMHKNYSGVLSKDLIVI